MIWPYIGIIGRANQYEGIREVNIFSLVVSTLLLTARVGFSIMLSLVKI